MKNAFVVSFAALAVSLAVGSLSAQGTSAQSTSTPPATPSPTPTSKPAASTLPKGQIIQKIIVKVNGEIFTQTDLEYRQIQALRDQQRTVKDPADLSSDPALIAALSSVTPTLLTDAVDELMLVQHAKEMGLKFTEAIFARAIEDLKKANKIPDDATFQKALKQEGLTMADLRQNFERQFYIGEVQRRELARNMTLTEEEARQYYNAHLDQFMKPETVLLREIVIAVPNENVGGQVGFIVSVDETAKQKITTIRERAIKGEDFVKLVAETSESGTKESGGVIGPVNTADLSTALAELLAKMKVGDITEPLRTKAGWQIIKLDTRSASQPETFERSRDQISQRILETRLDVERGKFLDKLRVQAVIEWKDEGYKKMYDAARAAHKTDNGK